MRARGYHARMNIESRIRGGVYGLLLGDVCGVPYETKPPEQLPPFDQIGVIPPDGYPREHAEQPNGTWSDDGALHLCTLDSLLVCGTVNQTDLLRRFLRYWRNGYMLLPGVKHSFGVGGTIRAALTRFEAGVPVSSTGDLTSFGNGTLMWMLALPLWHKGTDQELLHDVMLASSCTHASPAVLASCAVFAFWVRELMDGKDKESAWSNVHTRLKPLNISRADTAFDVWQNVNEIMAIASFNHLGNHWVGRPVPCGTGHVVDTLISARDAVMRGDSYANTVRHAIAFGHDTDTTAAVAGGVAGVIYGHNGIPMEWMNTWYGTNDGIRHVIEPLVAKLIERWR